MLFVSRLLVAGEGAGVGSESIQHHQDPRQTTSTCG
uniref:Uncharacterized protein n=1 Tax=Anguilla anguilla TaxID=7936 RepID=A0A0E9WLP3_ANGAN